jgi:CheY-like chemotaxis protein
VLTAHNGRTALTLARQAQPDLVLIDMMMPHIDAAALCAWLRSASGTSHLPILGMSAVPQAVANVGFTGFLAKPFELDEMLRCIGEALSHNK